MINLSVKHIPGGLFCCCVFCTRTSSNNLLKQLVLVEKQEKFPVLTGDLGRPSAQSSVAVGQGGN